MADKEQGTVKHYDTNRGFGFISRAKGNDVYVHQSEVRKAGLDQLSKGDQVTFEVVEAQKGPQAVNLEVFSPIGADYLEDGYFYKKPDSDKAYIREELVDSLAMDIARLLGGQDMKINQLRRFFSKARGIERKLDLEKDFEAIKGDLLSFKRDVAYQVGRGLAPNEFQQFIEKNVDLAIQNEVSFRRGFLQHFESILAYFVYLFRE